MEIDRRPAGRGNRHHRDQRNEGQLSAAARAAAALVRGELVILPTETVYGLAADAANARAVANLYAAKGRPAFNPLIAHVSCRAEAQAFARMDERALRLADAFWPGPLTLVAPYRGEGAICDLARAGLETVAVRAPAHPLARAVLAAFDGPIVAPSANRSGRPSPTSLAMAVAETGAVAAVALDGGACPAGLESSVVALLDGPPRLLRPGPITRAEIEALIGPLMEAEADARRSPGRLARHYAPRAPLRLDALDLRAGELGLGFAGRLKGAGVLDLSPAGNLAEAAVHFFAYLTRLDAASPAAIAVAPIPKRGLGEAINDRLRRAAGYIG